MAANKKKAPQDIAFMVRFDQKLDVGDWLPATAPVTGDNFCGIDRTCDVVRLAGTRIDASGLTFEEGIVLAAKYCAVNGGRPDQVLVPNGSFLHGLTIQGPTGPLVCHLENFVPPDTAFVVQSDTWAQFEADGIEGPVVCVAPAFNARVMELDYSSAPTMSKKVKLEHDRGIQDIIDAAHSFDMTEVRKEIDKILVEIAAAAKVRHYAINPRDMETLRKEFEAPKAKAKPKANEVACSSCGKPNDLGAKSCWWCEAANPTAR